MARHETCDIVCTKRTDAVAAGIGKWWLCEKVCILPRWRRAWVGAGNSSSQLPHWEFPPRNCHDATTNYNPWSGAPRTIVDIVYNTLRKMGCIACLIYSDHLIVDAWITTTVCHYEVWLATPPCTYSRVTGATEHNSSFKDNDVVENDDNKGIQRSKTKP